MVELSTVPKTGDFGFVEAYSCWLFQTGNPYEKAYFSVSVELLQSPFFYGGL